jgi:trans-aconitate 2-methyltransferase
MARRSPHDWDGTSYDRISAPLERNGIEVLERLKLRGEETVLDAGCGSGRVTRALLERLPDGQVIGVDGSPGMIEAASRRLGDRAELILCDLLELDLGERRVDAVFSSAVFHWLADHELLFARLHAVLRPGGRLVAQCGGEGNTPELLAALEVVGEREPFHRYVGGWSPWYYAGPQETEARLRACGFADVDARLVQRPAPYEDLRDWLRVNALSAHQLRLPAELRAPYVEEVATALGPNATITYIRLDIDATAAGPRA